MTASIRRLTRINAPATVAFRLSLSVDTHLNSMKKRGERAIAGVTSGQIGLGEEVTWTARHFAVSWTMTSRVSVLEWPTRFVDEQVRGPFASFNHEHQFRACGPQTEMTDIVSFAAPLGWLGRFAEVAGLRWYLGRLIDERNRYLKFEAERTTS